jgi:hypothetical protein
MAHCDAPYSQVFARGVLQLLMHAGLQRKREREERGELVRSLLNHFATAARSAIASPTQQEQACLHSLVRYAIA